MNTEPIRIADQLRRAFEGEAWHGPALREILAGVTAEQANTRPLAAAHTIWELVLHIEAWTNSGLEATARGVAMPQDYYGTEKDWPRVQGSDAAAWAAATERLFRTGEQLAGAIETFPEERLQETVPGRDYGFYHLFHGIVQHSLYHAGQIAMLKRAAAG